VNRRDVHLLERTAWFLAVLVALYFVGVGLDHTFQFEPTGDALREEALGFRMIRAWSVALVCLAGYGWWRGAPPWAWLTVLLVPALCGGLSEVAPQTLLPHLAFLGAGPLTGLAAVGAVFRPWRSLTGRRAPRPARSGGRSGP
jgi:hypothetical protein